MCLAPGLLARALGFAAEELFSLDRGPGTGIGVFVVVGGDEEMLVLLLL